MIYRAQGIWGGNKIVTPAFGQLAGRCEKERYEDGDDEEDVDIPDKALPQGTSCHIGCT